MVACYRTQQPLPDDVLLHVAKVGVLDECDEFILLGQLSQQWLCREDKVNKAGVVDHVSYWRVDAAWQAHIHNHHIG